MSPFVCAHSFHNYTVLSLIFANLRARTLHFIEVNKVIKIHHLSIVQNINSLMILLDRVVQLASSSNRYKCSHFELSNPYSIKATFNFVVSPSIVQIPKSNLSLVYLHREFLISTGNHQGDKYLVLALDNESKFQEMKRMPSFLSSMKKS